MRTFQTTHPWLKFEFDPSTFPAKLWLLLGECQSKCEHLAGVPLLPETASRINRYYLARGAKATTAIEGNTLTDEQVGLEIEGKLTLPPSQAYLITEVRNIARAYDDIFNQMFVGRSIPGSHFAGLKTDRICDFNRWILRDLPLAQHVIPGQIRTHAIAVGMYRGAPAEDCAYLLDRMTEWIASLSITDESPIVNGIVNALLVHLYIAWIHPFSDGNGRTARLVEYQILLQAGIPAPAVHLMSNHFNATRSEYYRQLEEASISGGDVIPFLEYAVTGFRDGLRDQLAYVREQQVDVMWRDLIFQRFGSSQATADRRRRDLMHDLTARGTPVSQKELTSISGRVAQAYAQVTPKTLARDLGVLKSERLVTVDVEGNLLPNKRIILSYLPPTLCP
ncbi:Fic family protein [candidate division KSB1 bacterium]|nr:Fic family protein [candidate division KSB1 bacterium]